MDKIRCIIVDDEPLAQQVIEKHIAQSECLDLVAKCRNAIEAFKLLHQQKIDLMFLDIRMPAISGIEFLRSLNDPPLVIFVTAWSEHAAQSYELEAVDYLLKPVTFARFEASIRKVFKVRPLKDLKDYLRVKVSGSLVKIYFRDIKYIESLKDYVKIHTHQGTFITLLTMKALEALLPADSFIRIHRSFIVAASSIRAVGRTEIKLDEIALSIGIRYRKKIKQAREMLS